MLPNPFGSTPRKTEESLSAFESAPFISMNATGLKCLHCNNWSKNSGIGWRALAKHIKDSHPALSGGGTKKYRLKHGRDY
jgi:hypothetical protein